MNNSNEKIFIQIASYRDPQLIPTILNCIENADEKDNLVFSIAWQNCKDDEWDNLDEIFKNDSRFKIIDIKHNESKGCCWARNLTQSQYTNEKYILQIDSHHRFIKGWDTVCKNMIVNLQKKGYKKPLITAYLPSFNPENDPESRVNEVWKLSFDRFTPEGIVLIKPEIFKDVEDYDDLPVPTRLLSAHFIFTLGIWNKEIPYDPNLYFHGEEITLAVRSYTHGYDLFIPNKVIAWHEYTRKYRTRHWDDHKDFGEFDLQALRRTKKILNVDGFRCDSDDFGIYDIGKVRSLEDYEKYSGIRFSDRGVQHYTKKSIHPPNPTYASDLSLEKSLVHEVKFCINLNKTSLNSKINHDLWVVAFEDDDGKTIFRKDADRKEILEIKKKAENENEDHYRIWREFEYKGIPAKWVIWPYSKRYGWDIRIVSPIRRIKKDD
jgi:hypothetical protein